MGSAVSCFEPGGVCHTPPKQANLDGPSQEIATRRGQTNVLTIHVGHTASDRLKMHLTQGRRCAIEVTVRVTSGRITAATLNVDTNPLGNRKLVALPIQPEIEQNKAPQHPHQQPNPAWSNAFAPGFNPHAAQGQSHGPHSPHGRSPHGGGHHGGDELGYGGVRFHMLPEHTNNFEAGDYYLTCNAIIPGFIVVTAQSLVEQVPGQGLTPLQVVTHQANLQNMIRDLPVPTVTFGKPQQQIQYIQSPSAMSPQPMNRKPYDFNDNMTLNDAQLHIRNLEQEINDLNVEISSLKKQNRSLDEQVYQYERTGGRNQSATATELQLNRYKDYILKAKSVIQQQKERIVDLETTTMVGRLEAHLLEYKEYASRQKLKLHDLSQDFELVDRELRETRDESEELRARYHLLKRQSKEYRDEPSPRRTPQYSRARVTRGYGSSGTLSPSMYDGLPGNAPRSPYKHSNALSEWERELLAPKTPTAANFSGSGGLLSREAEDRLAEARRQDRDRYDRDYERDRDRADRRDGLLSREDELRRAESRAAEARRDEQRIAEVRREEERREEARRERERDWDREYYRKHGRAPPAGTNPHTLPLESRQLVAGARHRNAVGRTVRPGASYYNRYGRYESVRDRAAMKIQAAWRGYLQRKRHAEKYGSRYRSRSRYGPSSSSSSTYTRPKSSYSSSRKMSPIRSAPRKLSPPRSSTRSSSKHTSHTHSRRSSRLSEDEAAKRIQHGWRSHLKRRDEKRRSSSKKSSSSTRHYGSSAKPKSSSSSHRSSSRERSDYSSYDKRSSEGYSSREGYSSSKGYRR